MNRTPLCALLLAAASLTACQRTEVPAQSPPPPAVVVVPGPAGAMGATGATGDTGQTGQTGDTGSTGKSGDGTTVIVVPRAASAPTN